MTIAAKITDYLQFYCCQTPIKTCGSGEKNERDSRTVEVFGLER
jgi:hypothetical protein